MTSTSFLQKRTSQPASHNGGAAMRLFLIPGKMLPIFASSGSVSFLTLIAFEVVILCPFGIVTFVVFVAAHCRPSD